MKGHPFELACRGGSLLINESRAMRRGTIVWALWRSQITGAGCALEPAGDDATVYLHLRDGRHFAVEGVTPCDCFRLFELFGYEPEPSAAAGCAGAPLAIDLGDRHTRVVSTAQGMRLEQDGAALLTLPRDQVLGVRVAAGLDTARVQIVVHDGAATQLDDVPIAAAVRLLLALGAAPDETTSPQSLAPLVPPSALQPDASAAPPRAATGTGTGTGTGTKLVAAIAVVEPSEDAAPRSLLGSPVAARGFPHALPRSLDAAPGGPSALAPSAWQRGASLASPTASTTPARQDATVRQATLLLWHAVLAAVTLRFAGLRSRLVGALHYIAALWLSLAARLRVPALPAARERERRERTESPQPWSLALRRWGMSPVQAVRAIAHGLATHAGSAAGAARSAIAFAFTRPDRRPASDHTPIIPTLTPTLALRKGRVWAHRRVARAYVDLRALPGSMAVQRGRIALLLMLAVPVLSTASSGSAQVRLTAPTVQTEKTGPSRAVVLPAAPADVVYAGSRDGAIYMLDAHTGTLLWRYDTGSPVVGGPVVVDGVIYAGEADGSIVALSAATHRELWRYHTAGTVRAAPAVVDGVVYAGSSDDHLYALRAGDGVLLWRFAASDRFTASPAVTRSLVYASSNNGTLYALRASDGTEVWQQTTAGGAVATPAIVNGTVYASSSGGTLDALDARTGAIVWRVTTGGSLYAAPIVVDGVIYMGSSDTNLYALQASDGTLRWKVWAGGSVTSTAVAGQTIYVSTADGILSAFQASDGALRWRYTSNGAGAVTPVVASGAVYASADDFFVLALDAQDGAMRWRYRTGGHVASSLIVVSRL